MAAKCIPCISDNIKKVIRAGTNDPHVHDILEKIATCPIESEITLCGRTKRAPGPYAVFIGECMKRKKVTKFGEAPQKMKECSLEWKQRPKK
jgi:hypothetical protein